MDQPAMVANYLVDEHDQRVVVAGMRLTQSIMSQPAMRRLNARAYQPGPDIRDEGDLLAAARDIGITQFHPISTCRMGHDKMAVVDPSLQVHGIDNLYVADASIMPTMISGNTNATTIMIGEKASDFLLDRQ